MNEQLYVYRDLINEHTSDFIRMHRNDKAALRTYKTFMNLKDQLGNKLHDEDEWALIWIGSYDRDTDTGTIMPARKVIELSAPGNHLTPNEIQEAYDKDMITKEQYDEMMTPKEAT